MRSASQIRDNSPIFCRVRYRKSPLCPKPRSVTELFSRLENPTILGANAARSGTERYSYWACRPAEVFEYYDKEENWANLLEQTIGKYQLAEKRPKKLRADVFCGGWMGYFAYELGGLIEPSVPGPAADPNLPLIRLCFYDRLICYDHVGGEFILINKPVK